MIGVRVLRRARVAAASGLRARPVARALHALAAATATATAAPSRRRHTAALPAAAAAARTFATRVATAATKPAAAAVAGSAPSHPLDTLRALLLTRGGVSASVRAFGTSAASASAPASASASASSASASASSASASASSSSSSLSSTLALVRDVLRLPPGTKQSGGHDDLPVLRQWSRFGSGGRGRGDYDDDRGGDFRRRVLSLFIRKREPRDDWRGDDWLIRGLIALNVLVFALWNTVGKDPHGQRWMLRHFSVSLHNLREGRVWTLLTAAVSQEALFHMLFNGMTLWFFGPHVMALLGTRQFLAFYAGSAVAASVAHVGSQLAMTQLAASRGYRYRESPAIGGSGTGMALSTVVACLAPRATFMLFGMVPVPAWACMSMLVAYDVYGALFARDGVAHAGHLGGAAFGALYWLLRIRRRRF